LRPLEADLSGLERGLVRRSLAAESAVSVSAGWSVFAMRDGAAYNTYRVYPHSRLITPLSSGLFELLPNTD
jgi:hypothetical protein